jgi:hypothetical protein
MCGGKAWALEGWQPFAELSRAQRFEDTRREAQKFGDRGTTLKA